MVPEPLKNPLISKTLIPIFLKKNPNSNDHPIALRKDKRACTQYPLSNFISYSHLSSSFRLFISSLDSCSVLKQNHCYSRLDSCDTGGDNGLRTEWDLGISHTSTGEESYWVQMSL